MAWTEERLNELSTACQESVVLFAAAELEVFDALEAGELTAEQLAGRIDGDGRATATLADALAAIGLLVKKGRGYRLAPGVAETLTRAGSASQLAMIQHRGNCLRGWAQLARAVRTGRPADRGQSVRGAEADRASFIEAMEVASRQAAPVLVEAIGPPAFSHLLDVGGGPATWTIAFLRAAAESRATLYDLPSTLPIARKHLAAAGLLDRVDLVAGDFYADAALPAGADLAWVSAIVHMNSRAQNRELFGKVHAALVPGGRILLRDVVMDASRTDPPGGAMFAVNMLVNTPGGGTFTLGELSEDLSAAGFAAPALLRRDAFMNSVVQATKGQSPARTSEQLSR
ncbi:MAG TPA: methyltransferase [Phycisphaerae bacterium]|nr:methyltransferase [Phycisphaerae bacterium]